LGVRSQKLGGAVLERTGERPLWEVTKQIGRLANAHAPPF
jgi:hypothetical protein